MRLTLGMAAVLLLGAMSPALAGPLDIGQPAPEVALTDLGGTTHRLSAYRGHGILLNFWATWCVPCRTEMPSMERASRTLKDTGLVVLAVNLEDAGARGAVEAFVKALGLSFPVLLDPHGESARAYRILGLPISFLVDRRGRLTGREIGPRDWSAGEARGKLEALLK